MLIICLICLNSVVCSTSVICPSAQGNLIYAILKLIYLLVSFDAAYGIASVLCVVEMKGFNGKYFYKHVRPKPKCLCKGIIGLCPCTEYSTTIKVLGLFSTSLFTKTRKRKEVVLEVM